MTSQPWNGKKPSSHQTMVWASRWSVALRTFYRQILSLLYSSFFLLKLPPPARPGTTCIPLIYCLLGGLYATYHLLGEPETTIEGGA